MEVEESVTGVHQYCKTVEVHSENFLFQDLLVAGGWPNWPRRETLVLPKTKVWNCWAELCQCRHPGILPCSCGTRIWYYCLYWDFSNRDSILQEAASKLLCFTVYRWCKSHSQKWEPNWEDGVSSEPNNKNWRIVLSHTNFWYYIFM